MVKRRVLVMLILILLITRSVVFSKVVNIGEAKYIERGDKGFYSIQYWNETYQNWYYVTYSKTYFTDNEGNRRIAYCCTPDANGIGWIPGEYEGYDTTIKYKLSNNSSKQQKLWRVFKNGFPYVNPEQLGVETEDDAYLATKQAAYFIIREKSENEVYDYFRPGEDYIDGQDLEETYRRGEKVIKAIYNLVYIGNNEKEEINNVSIIKNGEIQKKDEFSYQEFEIQSNNSEEKIEITSIENCPIETKIVDMNGEEKNTFYGGEKFKIQFPNNSVEKDYEIVIKYIATCKNYPVFYAESSISDTQDYLLTVDKFDDEEGKIKLSLNSKHCKFELRKIDEKTKKAIPGVKFRIEYKNGEKIGEYTTDENGIIRLQELRTGTIIVTEIEAPNDYIVDNMPREYKLCFNDTVKIEIDNKESPTQENEKVEENRIIKVLPRTGF